MMKMKKVLLALGCSTLIVCASYAAGTGAIEKWVTALNHTGKLIHSIPTQLRKVHLTNVSIDSPNGYLKVIEVQADKPLSSTMFPKEFIRNILGVVNDLGTDNCNLISANGNELAEIKCITHKGKTKIFIATISGDTLKIVNR